MQNISHLLQVGSEPDTDISPLVLPGPARSAELYDLELGHLYRVRVRAIGSAGVGAWSVSLRFRIENGTVLSIAGGSVY